MTARKRATKARVRLVRRVDDPLRVPIEIAVLEAPGFHGLGDLDRQHAGKPFAHVEVRSVRRYTGALDLPIATASTVDATDRDLEALLASYRGSAEQLDDIATFLANNAHLVRRFKRPEIQVLASEAQTLLARARRVQAATHGRGLVEQAAAACDQLAMYLVESLQKARDRDKPRPDARRADHDEVRRLKRDGLSTRIIAERTGYSESQVRRINAARVGTSPKR